MAVRVVLPGGQLGGPNYINPDGSVGITPPQAPSDDNAPIQISPIEGGPIAPIQQRPITSTFTPEPQAGEYDLNPTDPRNLESYNMWRNLAQSQGPTQYGREALNQIEANKQKQIGAIGQQAQGQFRQARNSLASRGGITNSMSSRLAGNLGNQAILAKQGAYRSSKNNILEALKADEGLKSDAQNKWAMAEGNFAQQSQDAAFRKYQLELAKWAANVGSDAFKTVTGR